MPVPPSRLACWLLALSVLGGCAVPADTSEVDAADEQLRSGPLVLDEAELRARVVGGQLEVRVPALSRWAFTLNVAVSVRTLDGHLLGEEQVGGLSDRAVRVRVSPGGSLDTLDAQAERVLHLRATSWPFELRSRRSLLAVLRAPAVQVDAPARVQVGAPVPVLVGAAEGTGLDVEVRGTPAQRNVLELRPGGVVAQWTVNQEAQARVSVAAEQQGSPRAVGRDVAVVERPGAYLVLARTVVPAGGFVDVVAVGAPQDGTATLELRDGTGQPWMDAPLPARHGAVSLGVLAVPPAMPAGTARVVLRWGTRTLVETPLAVAGGPDLPAHVDISAAEQAGQVTLRVRAQDPWRQDLAGSVEVEVRSGSAVTAVGKAALVAGAAEFRLRSAALLAGLEQGLVTVAARVTAPDGRSAGRVAVLPLRGAGLALHLILPACVAWQPCTLGVVALGVDGAGLPVQGEVRVDGVAFPLSADTAGLGRVLVTVEAPGTAVVQATACSADGRCGDAVGVLAVLQQGTPDGVLDVTPVGPVDVPLRVRPQTVNASAGLVRLQSPGLEGATTVDGTVWGASAPGAVDLRAEGPGVHRLRATLLGADGTVTARQVPVAVTPPRAAAPERSAGAPETVQVAAGELLLVHSTCGESELGVPWARGALQLPLAQRRAVGPDERLAALPDGALPALLADPEREDVAREPDAVKAQAVLETRVRADLDKVAKEARGLAATGELTPTMFGSWVVRRRDAYVDVFGSMYRLDTVGGRLRLWSRGPDERPGTQDDVEASVPLERLVSDAFGTPAPQLPPPGDAPLQVPAPATPLRWALGATAVTELPPCGLDGRVRALHVTEAGAVGALEFPARAAWSAALSFQAPPVVRVGDQVVTPLGGQGLGPFTLRAEAGGALLGTGVAEAVPTGNLPADPWWVEGTATRPGTGTWSVQAPSHVMTAAARTEVLPDGATRVRLLTRPCPGECAVELQAGEELQVWTGAGAACSAGRTALDSALPLEPAVVAWAAAESPGLGLAVERALQDALARAAQAQDPVGKALALEALWRMARSGTGRLSWRRDAWLQDVLAWVQTQPEAAFRALGLHAVASASPEVVRPLARQMLDAAVAAQDWPTVAWSLWALHLAGEADRGALDQLRTAPPSEVGAGVLAELALDAGRPEDARAALLALGALRGAWGSSIPMENGLVVAAWCRLAAGQAESPGATGVEDPAGAEVARWEAGDASPRSVVAARSGTFRVRGAAWAVARRADEVTSWDAALLRTRYPATSWTVGEVVPVSVEFAPVPPGPVRVHLQAPPGMQVLTDSIRTLRGPLPGERGAGEDVWLSLDAADLPSLRWELRGVAPGSVRAAPLEVWRPREQSLPATDAPPRLSVHR